ncbi:MAG: ammonium transporter [Dehalococcoidia bacterium]|nr:ammonium transporter [Dehalococcoidia bacterium]
MRGFRTGWKRVCGNKNTTTATAAITWMAIRLRHWGSPSVIGAAAGAGAGLAAILPASGFVDPRWAILIGLGAGIFCYLGVQLNSKLRIHDSLVVCGVHGIGGTWGALATGLYATVAVN